MIALTLDRYAGGTRRQRTLSRWAQDAQFGRIGCRQNLTGPAELLLTDVVMRRNQAGNALFLILIAVVLFAALSYAVTRSGRGSGGIDREKTEILAAQIIDQVGRIQAEIQRLNIIEGYDQVHFNEEPRNTNGNCYSGGQVTTGCLTVGLFGPDVNLPKPLWSPGMFSSVGFGAGTWGWQTRRLQIAGADLGTAAPDIFLTMDSLRSDLCAAINRRTNGNGSIGILSTFAGGVTTIFHRRDGTIDAAHALFNGNDSVNLPHEGCVSDSGAYFVPFFIIEQN